MKLLTLLSAGMVVSISALGCGGGGGDSGSVARGSVAFQVKWPESASDARSAANFGQVIPASVQSIRLTFHPTSSPDDACCVSIRRGSAAFESRSLIVNDLLAGPMALGFSAFVEVGAPSGGVTRTCTTDPASQASPCNGNSDVPMSFGADPVEFEVASGTVTNAGVINVYSLPFLIAVDPARGGSIPGPDPVIRLSVVDASRAVNGGIVVEIENGNSGPPILVEATAAPTECDDSVPGRLCSPNGALNVAGLTFAGRPNVPIDTGPVDIRVRARNDDDPARTLDVRYPVSISDGPPASTCEVVFQLVDPTLVGSLQWETQYDGAPGRFAGDAETAQCTPLTPPTVGWAFFDDGAQKVLTAAMIDIAGVTGPVDLVRCLFEGPTAPAPSDFAITVLEASGPDPANPIDPLPEVRIRRIGCDGTSTTTTTSTTTSTTSITDPMPTTTTTVSTTSMPTTSTTTMTTMSTTTSTVPILLQCAMRFQLADDVTLAALQYRTDYSSAPGHFAGSGGLVNCVSLIAQSISSFNDVDAQKSLSTGVISFVGFTGPVDVAECQFDASITPVPSDFAITVLDATDSEGSPIVPVPDIVVSSIQCQ